MLHGVSPRHAPHRVLLVEDHVSLAKAMAFLMRQAGLEVWIAATGRDALRMADEVRPDIVLCDLRLQDMTGLDVARELRASSGAKDALIAIHTAMDEAYLNAFKPDASLVNVYVPKPLTLEKLDALVSGLRKANSTERAGPRRKSIS